MNELYLRTEDIGDQELLDLCVETKQDREIINLLKSRTPVVLVGSRGVGKTFLMKVAERELHNDFAKERILPVYISFIKSSLIAVNKKGSFLQWMLAKICARVVLQLKRDGIIVEPNNSIDILSGGAFDVRSEPKIATISKSYEDSWRGRVDIDESSIPTVEDVKEAIEEICDENDIKRIVLFIDEAAHNFIREQQAEFFTLFRDLRCAKISCKAAVYPGVTAYGDIFQMSQDAISRTLNRFVQDEGYVDFMKSMVVKQIDEDKFSRILLMLPVVILVSC